MSNIKNWQSGTGSYKIGEIALAQGELVTNGGFDTDSDWAKETGWSISDGKAQAMSTTGNLTQTNCVTVNKTYLITYEIKDYVSGSVRVELSNDLSPGITRNSNGIFTEILIANSNYIQFDARDSFTGSIDNVSVVEIPPLPTITTGTKYLENTTAGTTAIQSKQAYGEWEWDVYKGAEGNNILNYFISETLDLSGNKYAIWINSDEKIILREFQGVAANIFQTETSYISNNTWYRIKVARLQSEGVFKDIETLQTSDFINSSYDTFVSGGRYGFRVSNITASTGYVGTVNEISIVNNVKYLVEFDMKLYSGTAPNFRLRTNIGSSSVSNDVNAVDGRNSAILTATSTTIGVLDFRNLSSTTDYEVSGLTIRRIYPADTFAVFIKGGEFGDDWTLVDTTGGSGTNPVTDSTYTTSNYFVAELDQNDRLANIKIMDGVEQ